MASQTHKHIESLPAELRHMIVSHVLGTETACFAAEAEKDDRSILCLAVASRVLGQDTEAMISSHITQLQQRLRRILPTQNSGLEGLWDPRRRSVIEERKRWEFILKTVRKWNMVKWVAAGNGTSGCVFDGWDRAGSSAPDTSVELLKMRWRGSVI